MATVITETEYIEINGLPMSTPAWKTTDLSGLYDLPEIRGEDRMVPYHEGVLPLRRWPGPKRVQIPIVIFGNKDKEDATQADRRIGLQANVDELKQDAFRPKQNATDEGVITIRHHLADGTVRAADGIVASPFQPKPIGVDAVQGVLDLYIPKAVFRDESDTNHVTTGIAVDTDIVVSNPGTADQYEAVILLEGTATSVKLINKTWDVSEATFLELTGAVEDGGVGTTIDTGAWTAVRNAISVIGLIEHSGHERWFPLLPGNNTIEVQPTGGSVDVTIDHKAAYL